MLGDCSLTHSLPGILRASSSMATDSGRRGRRRYATLSAFPPETRDGPTRKGGWGAPLFGILPYAMQRRRPLVSASPPCLLNLFRAATARAWPPVPTSYEVCTHIRRGFVHAQCMPVHEHTRRLDVSAARPCLCDCSCSRVSFSEISRVRPRRNSAVSPGKKARENVRATF